MKKLILCAGAALCSLFLTVNSTSAQGTAFTYQGRLNIGTNPTSGNYDLKFALFGASSGGSAAAGPLTNSATGVINGLFITTLDFGAGVFAGTNLWLEVGVRTNGGGSFNTLTPRQPLTPTPYAITAQTLAAVSQFNNIVPGQFATVAGGYENGTDGAGATVGGGEYNAAFGNGGTVSGGSNNIDDVDSATIGGGEDNTAFLGGEFATIGGGYYNGVLGQYATVGGGYDNAASGGSATVAGGEMNNASDGDDTVGGGNGNTASGGLSTVGGGYGNTASGYGATVPGGYGNTAEGEDSFAAGYGAQAAHHGAFVWADSTDLGAASTGPDQFVIRAAGGIQLSTNTSIFCGNSTRQMLNLYQTIYGVGVQSFNLYFRTDPSGGFSWFKGGVHSDTQYSAGSGGTEVMRLDSAGNLKTLTGTISSLSDRNSKENFEPVNNGEVLEKVASLPLSKWSYKTDKSSRHLGPMAQDFYAAFNIGLDDKSICSVDEDGVALAAIQALNQKLEQKETEIAELKARLGRLEQLMSAKNGGAK